MNHHISSTHAIATYLAVVVILLTVLISTAQAATLTVTNTSDGGAGSLRGALASGASGDTDGTDHLAKFPFK